MFVRGNSSRRLIVSYGVYKFGATTLVRGWYEILGRENESRVVLECRLTS